MSEKAARRIAVIDIGKTNAKVALVDLESFAEVAFRMAANGVLRDGPYPHYDIEALWAFILGALADLGREHGIDAITVTAHGATCALLDGEGALALPVLDYEHDGPDALAAEYDAARPAFATSGSPRLPLGLNLGAQLFWLQRRFRQGFAGARTILMYPQYWSCRLTGVAAGEITSLGCHTDLWSPAARDYSALVEGQGWRDLFPPLRKASDSLGPIRPEIATRTGLAPQTPVHCGIHDSNASLLPHLLARQPPFAVVSTGTWVVAMAVGGAAVTLDPARDTLVNINALGDPVPSARFMGGREHALLMAGTEASAGAAEIASVLESRALLLPSVQTGSGPFPNRQAHWRGKADLTPAERQAAVSFYLAMMTAVCLELIGAAGVTIVEGPFAGNGPYLRMLSAATGREVFACTGQRAGTSLGAALLASQLGAPPLCEGRTVTETGRQWMDYAACWRAACS